MQEIKVEGCNSGKVVSTLVNLWNKLVMRSVLYLTHVLKAVSIWKCKYVCVSYWLLGVLVTNCPFLGLWAIGVSSLIFQGLIWLYPLICCSVYYFLSLYQLHHLYFILVWCITENTNINVILISIPCNSWFNIFKELIFNFYFYFLFKDCQDNGEAQPCACSGAFLEREENDLKIYPHHHYVMSWLFRYNRKNEVIAILGTVV